MIAVILPIREIAKVEEASVSLRLAYKILREELTELEDQPRHAISHESIVIAQKTEVLNQIQEAIWKLDDLFKIVNEDYTTKADIDQSISASSPYNTGSRENY